MRDTPTRGGSTLTPATGPEVSGWRRTGRSARKLREILYAVEMEQSLGKLRLLTLYLNTVEWGPGIQGVRQAARVYFGKEPRDLRPEEAAWAGGDPAQPLAGVARAGPEECAGGGARGLGGGPDEGAEARRARGGPGPPRAAGRGPVVSDEGA